MLAKKINTAKNKFLDLLSYLAGRTPMVLLYHRVNRLPSDPQLLSVSPENFHAQIHLLKKEFDLLAVDEFLDCLTKKNLPRHAILLTFDDGYADNLYHARPVLEDLSAQALFFITTSLIGTDRELWWDELERIFLLTNELPSALHFAAGGHDYNFDTSTMAARHATYNQLHGIVKYQHFQARERLLEGFRQWAGLEPAGRPSHRLMNWDEVREFAGSGAVVIGAHTVHHTPLSILEEHDQRQEILLSRKKLEVEIALPVKYFSYPFGIRRDYSDTTVRICRESGFALSFANVPGYVRDGSDRFQLPRILVRDWEARELKTQLKKFQG